MRRTATAVALAAAIALSGCTADAPERGGQSTPSAPLSPEASARSPGADAAVWLPAGPPEVVAGGLGAPWSVVPLDDGTQLVSLRDAGDVVEVGADGTVRAVGTVPGVAAGGEAGLHGLAVLGAEGQTWLYAYLGTADDNRVVRMPLLGAAGQRTLGPVETVIDGIPRARTHNGGRIAFGPDGLLYVATGDANMRDAAQDPASLAGKILRLTPDGEAAPGNPFGNEVHSLGHRNVQGLAWTADGTMWASEFGQNSFDELNRIVAGGNYGWPVHEGVGAEPEFVDPLVTWTPAEASPSGLAAVGNTLFVASLRGERVWMLHVEAGAPEPLWTAELGRIRDVVVSGDALWLLTNNTDGRGSPGPDDDRLMRSPLAPAS